jgi:hypothetical protein
VIPSFPGGPRAIRSRLQYGSFRRREAGGFRAWPGQRYRATGPRACIAARLGADSQPARSFAAAGPPWHPAMLSDTLYLICPPVSPRNNPVRPGTARRGRPGKRFRRGCRSPGPGSARRGRSTRRGR